MIDLNLNPTKKELRIFSLALWWLFSIVGLIVWRKTGSATTGMTLSLIGLVLAAIGFAVPTAMRPVFIVMNVVNYPIAWTFTHIIMAFIFYFVVTPVGVIMRWTGRDPMERVFDRKAKTYWKSRRIDPNPGRYFRQF
jgi:hypothetical protein